MIDVFLHLDTYVGLLVEQYGVLTYAILFLIIFAETGLVIAPFLPGDSLLFTVGAFAGSGSLNIVILLPLFLVAAVLGDATNYWIGGRAGEKILASNRFIKESHIEKTKRFYTRWGGRAIVMARFIPIVRTVAPFIAGVAHMPYERFTLFNVIGAFLWVPVFLGAGYFFGAIPAIQDNFGLVILGVIMLSITPGIIEVIRARREALEENTSIHS